MFQAVKERASDIHIEPDEKDISVRYRIDGVLREVIRPPKRFQASIIEPRQDHGGLNIAEKRLPQDGRIRIKIAGKDVDIRVSTVPDRARRADRDAPPRQARTCSSTSPSSASSRGSSRSSTG